ncbi:MAG: histidinol-phosphate transaminase [Chloroflexi bacterium]|nr:histidinol-phosphate transaminase [Chloroflexota bacterium]
MLHANAHIDRIAPCIHGGINSHELRELGLDHDRILDFSVSCNPFGPPENIRASLNEAPIEIYPDPESSELVQALADKLNVSPDNIIACNGSTELIRLAAIAYFCNRDKVLISQPTYGDYELACRQVNVEIIKYKLNESHNYYMDVDEFIEFTRLHRPKAIFICNPNNPTGQYLDRQKVEKIISIFDQSLIILDEAYIALTQNKQDTLDLINLPNLLVCRSMTKDFALAGLRLGYGVASSKIIAHLKKVRPPWNVNSMAQKAGITALGCDKYLVECTNRIFEAKQYLIDELSTIGFQVIPSQTNYFLIKVGEATKFRKALLKEGFIVRDCTSFGLKHYVRIAPRAIEDCRKLINAIKAIKGILA